jgi:hypothetical protein
VIGARPERPRRHDAAVDKVVYRLVGCHLDADRLAVAVRLRGEPGSGDDPRRRRPAGGASNEAFVRNSFTTDPTGPSAATRVAASGGLRSPPGRDDIRQTPHGKTPYEDQEVLPGLGHRVWP